MDSSQHFSIPLKTIVPEYYSTHRWVRNLFLERHKAALSYLSHIRPERALDLGCGDGLFTLAIQSQHPSCDVVGVDLNENIHTLIERHPHITFLHQDLRSLSLNERFDCCALLDVLEHFETPQEVLEVVKDHLTPEGYLVLSGPVEDIWYKLGRFITKGTFSQEKGPGSGKHYNDVKKLDKIITSNGFSLVKQSKIRFLAFHAFDVNLYKVSS